MGNQAMEQMVGILPDGFRDDEGGLGIYIGEDLHTLLLGLDEAVFAGGVARVGADQFIPEFGEGGREGLFHGQLRGPADFIGGLALVAIGDEEDFLQGLGHGN